MDPGQLWLQDKIYKGEIGLQKVDGKRNLADACTKEVEGRDLELHINGIGLVFKTGRHELAPEVADWNPNTLDLDGQCEGQ